MKQVQSLSYQRQKQGQQSVWRYRCTEASWSAVTHGEESCRADARRFTSSLLSLKNENFQITAKFILKFYVVKNTKLKLLPFTNEKNKHPEVRHLFQLRQLDQENQLPHTRRHTHTAFFYSPSISGSKNKKLTAANWASCSAQTSRRPRLWTSVWKHWLLIPHWQHTHTLSRTHTHPFN